MKSQNLALPVASILAGISLLAATTMAEDNTSTYYTNGLVNGVSGDVVVGTSGTNNYLEVSNSTTLTNSGDADISLNGTAKNNLAVVSGPGSTWNVGASSIIGYFGTDARLLITNGGVVNSTYYGIIGYYYDYVSNNVVTVTGAGSTWNIGPTYGLWVGGNGHDNKLIVENGGSVTNRSGTAVGVGASSSNNLVLVTGSGSVLYTGGNDFGIGGGGGNSVVVANGGSLISPNFRTFGGFSPNQILVTNGGFVQTINLSFSESAANGGNLIKVSGTGSVYTNLDSMLIGQSSSNNTLVIENGGKMYNRTNTYVGGYFGSAGAYNNILVTGPGSLLDMNASGSPSSVSYFGYTGDGNTMTISDGGRVNATVLYNGTSSNRITVAGSDSTLNVSTIFYAGYAGYGNQIIVTNGGKVVTPSTTFGYYGSGGSLEVTGSGSVYSNAGIFGVSVFGGTNTIAVRNGGSLYVGDSLNIGSNTGEGDRLITTGGGQVKVLTNLVIGNSHGNSGFISDPGSVWDVGITLFVGNLYANNTLVITNGAVVRSGQGIIGNYGPYYGYPGTNNSVLVTGAGSVWSNTLYGLYVGNVGEHSQLRIENGGKVYNAAASYATIIGGYYSASNAYVSVTGAGSLLSTPNQDIIVGNYLGANNSALVVADGGRVDAGVNLIVGSYSSYNYVTITNGGKVYSAQGIIGYIGGSGGGYGHYNSVNVSGNGSVWSNSTYPIYVGLNGSSNRLVISDGGTVYTPTTYVSYGAESTNNIVNISGNGSLLQNGSIYVGNVTGPTSGQDAHVNLTDGGTLDTPYMATGISGSGTISNRGGIYQFPTAAPTIAPNTANSITISNGTIAYRDVASANIFNAQVANIAFAGNNAFRLNNSSNSALSSYTFNTGLGATNYNRLELINGGSRWQSTTLNIGSGGSLLVSNGANASIAANVSIAGLAEVANSKATFGGTVNISGRLVSDPSTNTFLADVTVAQSGTMAGGSGDLFDFKKSFYVHSTNQIGFNLSQSAVRFGGGGIHTNAITGMDMGSGVTAFDSAFTYQTNFAYGELHIETAADQICFECGNIPLAPSNALYVGWLDLLNNLALVSNLHASNNINIYYSALDTRNAYLGNQTFQLTACDGVTLGGFLLPVIPEPSVSVFLGVGILATLGTRRRHSKP